MKSQYIFIAIGIVGGLIMPIEISQASKDSNPKLEINEIKEVPIVGGVRQNILDYLSYKVPGKSNDYLDTAEITTMGPMGHQGYLVSIKELAEKTRYTDYRFNFSKEENTYKITMGEDYKGDPYKRIVDKSVNASLAKSIDGQIEIDDKSHPISIYKIDGNDFIRYSDLMNILYGIKPVDLENFTDDILKNELLKSDYTILANWDANDLGYNENCGKKLVSLYKASKKSKDKKIGFLSLAAYGNLFREDELALGFPDQEIPFKTYASSDNFFDNLNLNDIYLFDKNMQQVGKSFQGYKEEYYELYIANKNKGEEKKQKSPADDILDGKIDAIIAANFLDYTLKGKKVSLEDKAYSDFNKEEILMQKESLEKAIEDNKIIVKSAKYLLENTPKTVKNVKGKLINMIKNAESLQEKGKARIRDLDKALENL